MKVRSHIRMAQGSACLSLSATLSSRRSREAWQQTLNQSRSDIPMWSATRHRNQIGSAGTLPRALTIIMCFKLWRMMMKDFSSSHLSASLIGHALRVWSTCCWMERGLGTETTFVPGTLSSALLGWSMRLLLQLHSGTGFANPSQCVTLLQNLFKEQEIRGGIGSVQGREGALLNPFEACTKALLPRMLQMSFTMGPMQSVLTTPHVHLASRS